MFEIKIAFSSYRHQFRIAALLGKLEEVKRLVDVVDVNCTDPVSAETNTSGKIAEKSNRFCGCIHALFQTKGDPIPY